MTPGELEYYKHHGDSVLRGAVKGWNAGTMSWEDVLEVAIAYARPIVCEECARIVERDLLWYGVPTIHPVERDMTCTVLADAIREHGKEKP